MTRLDRLTVRGFKSIRALEDLGLRPLNVMIGATARARATF